MSTNSFANTPQARDDSFYWTEDALLGASVFDVTRNVVRLNVMSNDLGGNAKKLWSIDNGDFLNDLQTNNVNTGWEATANGNLIRIYNGQIELDFSNSLIATAGADDVNALAEGAVIMDSFTYAIRLGNGTLSAATVSFTLVGENDVATITETAGGDYTVQKSGELSFAAPELYSVAGSDPTDIVLADVNDDGFADIVTANISSSTVSVLLNDGSGDFGPAIVNVGVMAPDGVTVADVIGDDFADIVTADASSQTVSVLIGNGTGVFGAAVHYILGAGYAHRVEAVDVDGDFALDLVACSDNGVSVLLNNGGGFDPAVFYSAGIATAIDVAVGDVDDDGDADIVLVGITSSLFPHPGSVAVLLNDGEGGFDTPTAYSTGGDYSPSIALADVDGNDSLDIVTTNGLSGTVSVLSNNGAGVFAVPLIYDAGATFAGGPPTPYDIAVADMNGDGNLDIVTANPETDNVSVLLGDGSGGFGAANTFGVNGDISVQLALADLDGNGTTDIVTANQSSDDVSVLINGTPGDPYASGDLDISDADAGEAKFAAVAPAELEGTYGDFLFDADTGEWSYVLDNLDPDTMALGPTDSVSDTLLVTSYDGYTSHMISVSVFGSMTEPVI